MLEEKGKVSLYSKLLEKESNKNELQDTKNAAENLDARSKSIEDQKKTIEDAYTLIKYRSPEMLRESYAIMNTTPDVSLDELRKIHDNLTQPYRLNKFKKVTESLFGQKLKSSVAQKSAEALELESVQEMNEKTIAEAYDIIHFQSPSLLQESYKILGVDANTSEYDVYKKSTKLRALYFKNGKGGLMATVGSAYDIIKRRSPEFLKKSYKDLGLEQKCFIHRLSENNMQMFWNFWIKKLEELQKNDRAEQLLINGNYIELSTDSDFEALIATGKVVVADFYAT